MDADDYDYSIVPDYIKFNDGLASAQPAVSGLQTVELDTDEKEDAMSVDADSSVSIDDPIDSDDSSCLPPRPELKAKGSLVDKHLTPELWKQLCNRFTSRGYSLCDVLRASLQVEDAGSIGGVKLLDSECLDVFEALLLPIIKERHQLSPTWSGVSTHPHNYSLQSTLDLCNTVKQRVRSARARVARSFKGYPLTNAMSKEEFLELEHRLLPAFKKLGGKFHGNYHSWASLTKEDIASLQAKGLLFREDDEVQQVAGMRRYFPEGRGVYISHTRLFSIWLCEEDHIRITSVQQGNDLRQAFQRLCAGIQAFEAAVNSVGLEFQETTKCGYLGSGLSNLGTGLRAGVHIHLPEYASNYPALSNKCKALHLGCRSTHGNDDPSGNTAWVDISNRNRLGRTEWQLFETLVTGLNRLVAEIEKTSKCM